MPAPQSPNTEELDRAAAIVARAPATYPAAALTGDKRLLFDDAGAAFVMYQVRGRSWITMGNPVGSPSAIEPLAWRFRELSHEHGGRPVFYQVDAEFLSLYLDLGLAPLKIGEEALIPLQGFSLEGGHRADLRQAKRRMTNAGAAFEVLSANRVLEVMAELERVSSAWLAERHAAEKGFSVGRFQQDYLIRFPCAVVRLEGTIVAFANLWTGDSKTELSIDLMRHTPAAPHGIMDFLFAELMLWGAAQGYAWFNLGVAPLSGLESHPLAPMWHRIGHAMFRYGEYFYNFEGLRAYKEKFHPVWRPKYLAAPRSLALPAVLLDVATLISGGVRGIVTK